MLQTERMRKVTVLTTQGYLQNVIEELHKQEVIDIISHRRDDEADIGEPLEQGDKISELLVSTRSLISLLGIKPGEKPKKHSQTFAQTEKRLAAIAKEVNEKIDLKREVEDEMRGRQALLEDLSLANRLDIPLEAFTEFSTLTRFVGNLKDPERVSDRINNLTDKYEIFVEENGHLSAIFVAKNFEQEVKNILDEEGFSEVAVTLEEMSGKAAKKIVNVTKEIDVLTKKINNIDKDIHKIRRAETPYLLGIDTTLSIEAEKADAPLRFATSQRAFMVSGWVQKSRVDNLKEKIKKITSDRVYIKIEKPEKKEDVPVKLQNKKLAKPFEVLMDLFALPMYKEMDPTFLMFLTFPLFFGFMLGDWGYGLTTLLLFFILKKLIPAGRQFFNILMLASVSTIFFGILFGEFFGLEVVNGYDMWRVLSRGHQVQTLLYIAVGIGVVHINWGLINGFINEYRNHGLKMAILEKGSWFILQAVAVMIALSALQIWRLKLWVSIALLLIPIYMIWKGEGTQGLVEIPGIASNMLSYARLMAIGLASVKLAEVVNEFAGEFFSQGGMGIVYAVLLLVVGHTINIALGIIGPFLHSLRLHYVEYFGKFFKGGARKFRPFGARE